MQLWAVPALQWEVAVWKQAGGSNRRLGTAVSGWLREGARRQLQVSVRDVHLHQILLESANS